MSEQIISKRCSKCKQFKSLSEFYKDRSRGDGLHSCCKSCIKIRDRKYQQTPNGKAAHRKGVAKYHKTINGKAAHRKAAAKFYANHPNYEKATSAVNNAIRADRLPRANTRLCHYCPAQAQEYHHWHGYEPEFWLDIVPACVECHTKEHRKIA